MQAHDVFRRVPVRRWIRPVLLFLLACPASARVDRPRDKVPEIDGSTARAGVTLLLLGVLILAAPPRIRAAPGAHAESGRE